MKNYEFDPRSLSHLIKLNDKKWIKVPKNSIDRPFDIFRDPVSGCEKLSYMEEYGNFEEAEEAAEAYFEKNDFTPQEIGKKAVYVWLIDRKIGSLLQPRNLETATVDDCVLVQYRVFGEPVEEPFWDKDDGEYVKKDVRYEEVFSCLVCLVKKEEEEEEECDECRLVPRAED